jgi:GNAT superfamily N-acetyltransferase
MKFKYYVITDFQPKFIPQIANLERTLWSNELEKNFSYFKWKYEDNPFSEEPIAVVAIHKNVVIGFRGFFVTQWTVNGIDKIRLLSPSDVVVHPDHRRQGLFTAMTIEDIQRISKNNLVTIGSHTVNHAIIPNCTDVELEYEINNSKKELENWTGKEVKYFSYPNGDFDGREKEILEKYGFELAATTENNAVSIDSYLYSIPRYSVMNDGSFAENLCHMLGIWQPFISKIKRRLNYSKM